MTNNPSYPFNPSGREYRSLFEAPTNWAEAYGGRMRGYLTPTTTGDYWFWIASDDNGELWLSTDSNPDNKTRIAYVPGWTSSREWTWYAEQKSASIHLVAGNRYYVEALMKEGGGGDNLAVAWQRDGTAFDGLPIPAEFLTPYTETISTLLVTPSVQTLLTNDTTPLLGGSVNDPNVALTVGLAGRYYAATRNSNTTWLLPDGVIEPALANGTYDVVACATDAASRTAFDTTTNELVIDTTSPTADIVDVTPDPRETAVGVVTINFTEDVVGVDTSDFRLTRNGGEVDLVGLSVTRVNGRRYTMNLSSVTVANGAYVLTLTAEGSGIRDLAGNALTVAASDAWRRGTVNNPPTLDAIPDPDPIDEDAGRQTIVLTGISAGTGEDQPLAITAQSDTPGLIDVVQIAYSAGATTAALSFTPVSDAWGSARITVTVEDAGPDRSLSTHGDNAQVSRSFVVTVNSVKDVLIAVDDTYTGTENAVLTVDAPGVLRNDKVVDLRSLVLVSPPKYGTLTLQQDGSFTYVPWQDFNREDSFKYWVENGATHSDVATVELVIGTAFPWYNGANPVDVNGNGDISPLDALLIINTLNLEGRRELPSDRPRPLESPFYDVSRDAFVSPLDALFVINYLSRGEGEGEADRENVTDSRATTAADLWWCFPVSAKSNSRAVLDGRDNEWAEYVPVEDSRGSTVLAPAVDLLFTGLGEPRGARAWDPAPRGTDMFDRDLEEFLESVLSDHADVEDLRARTSR